MSQVTLVLVILTRQVSQPSCWIVFQSIYGASAHVSNEIESFFVVPTSVISKRVIRL